MDMKKAILAAACGLLSLNSAQATTVFSPELNNIDNTFENADFFNFSIPANYQLGLFDYTDTGFNNALFVNSGDSVSFAPNTPSNVPVFDAINDMSGYSITVSATDPQPGTPSFILGLLDTQTSTWHGDAGATPLNLAGNAWNVSFETAPGVTTSVDVVLSAVVPTPPAAWLFAAGLVGFAGIARSHRRAG